MVRTARALLALVRAAALSVRQLRDDAEPFEVDEGLVDRRGGQPVFSYRSYVNELSAELELS